MSNLDHDSVLTCYARWPGAYNHGGVRLGLRAENGMLVGVQPGDALSLITGLRTTYHVPKSQDDLWHILTQVQANNTPIVLTTLYEAKTITGSHAFAVLNTSIEGGTKRYESFLFTCLRTQC